MSSPTRSGEITVSELWQGRARASELWVPADAGLDQALASQLAQGALTLVSVTGRDRGGLLDGADEVLGVSGASAAGSGRNVVFHAAWLARAQVAAGDLDRAALAGRTAVRRRAGVRSRRCGLILHRLTDDLAALPAHRQPASLRELTDQLRVARVA